MPQGLAAGPPAARGWSAAANYVPAAGAFADDRGGGLEVMVVVIQRGGSEGRCRSVYVGIGGLANRLAEAIRNLKSCCSRPILAALTRSTMGVADGIELL
jgi:hypothetical protein